MSLSEWIPSVLLCAAVCSAALYFLSGNPSQKSVKLLCGLIMSAVTLFPVGSLFQNFQGLGEKALIFSDYANTLDTEESELSQSLIEQTAQERLSALVQEEMERRLGRSDFRVGVCSDGTAWLSCPEDFPREEARQILSALLGGCEVRLVQGRENDG